MMANQAVSCVDCSVKVILPYESSDEIYIEKLENVNLKPVYVFLQRFFDIFFSSLALIVLSLPIAVIAAAVKLSSKGPAFFKQERLGKDGKKFYIWKFRTMKMNAEKNGARWTLDDNDERVTTVGRFLRKTRLDELPQFFNVFVGNMTLIGPRPERECFYVAFEKYIHGFGERLKVKPGITGYAQVYGGYFLKPEEKVIYDIEYIKNRSVMMDLRILLKTTAVLINAIF